MNEPQQLMQQTLQNTHNLCHCQYFLPVVPSDCSSGPRLVFIQTAGPNWAIQSFLQIKFKTMERYTPHALRVIYGNDFSALHPVIFLFRAKHT